MLYLSRQHYWGVDEPLVVEIADGGLDYANPDMLCDTEGKYSKLGCDQEYTDPREALKAAIAVRDEWAKGDDLVSVPRIECGYTGGNTIPFEEFPDDDDLKEWAEQQWNAIPKCDQCGEPLPENKREQYHLLEWDLEERFCSEYCAENYAESLWEEEEEDSND